MTDIKYQIYPFQKDFKALRKLPKHIQLFSNGIVPSKGGGYESTLPYHRKCNIATRCAIYAIADILNDRQQPFKALIKERVIKNKREYIQRILYRYKNDVRTLKLSVDKQNKQYEKIKNIDELYNSNYVNFYADFKDTFFTISKRKNSRGHYTHFITLTSSGKMLMKYINAGFIL